MERNIKIAVLGLGYVGLPLARLFSTKYETTGFDLNSKRCEDLMKGHDVTLEVADEVLQDAINNHGFICTSNIEDIKDINYKVSQDENGEILCFEEKIPLKIIAKLLFQKVIETAKEQFKKEINYCTVSVPQGFNTSQRNAIIEAATLEGIKEVFIINDPLSAGIYYISKNKLLNLENFLIIDFGSSKLDISLITISKHNSIRIIKVGGDGSLGGGIFDKELLQEILETYKSEG
jgi:molecular chaperone DnaK (HSP70)